MNERMLEIKVLNLILSLSYMRNNRIPQGEWRLHPESVRMIWTRYGKAEVDLFATSENAESYSSKACPPHGSENQGCALL